MINHNFGCVILYFTIAQCSSLASCAHAEKKKFPNPKLEHPHLSARLKYMIRISKPGASVNRNGSQSECERHSIKNLPSPSWQLLPLWALSATVTSLMLTLSLSPSLSHLQLSQCRNRSQEKWIQPKSPEPTQALHGWCPSGLGHVEE